VPGSFVSASAQYTKAVLDGGVFIVFWILRDIPTVSWDRFGIFHKKCVSFLQYWKNCHIAGAMRMRYDNRGYVYTKPGAGLPFEFPEAGAQEGRGA